MYKSEMLEEKTWKDFRATGLAWLINSILHVFGWVIVFKTNDEDSEILAVFPARTKFRGFSEQVQTEEHEKIAQWIADNGNELLKEVKS